MERKKLLTHIVLPAVIGGLFVFFISEPGVILLFTITPRHDIPSYEEISDPELMNRSSDLPEVRAYLDHYPNSTTYIDPLNDFSVVYHVNECQVYPELCEAEPSGLVGRYNALTVRLDDNGYPKSSVLYCVHEINGQQKTFKIENSIFWKNKIIEFLDKDVCIFWYRATSFQASS